MVRREQHRRPTGLRGHLRGEQLVGLELAQIRPDIERRVLRSRCTAEPVHPRVVYAVARRTEPSLITDQMLAVDRVAIDRSARPRLPLGGLGDRRLHAIPRAVHAQSLEPRVEINVEAPRRDALGVRRTVDRESFGTAQSVLAHGGDHERVTNQLDTHLHPALVEQSPHRTSRTRFRTSRANRCDDVARSRSKTPRTRARRLRTRRSRFALGPLGSHGRACPGSGQRNLYNLCLTPICDHPGDLRERFRARDQGWDGVI
jgi:hypothetical protein